MFEKLSLETLMSGDDAAGVIDNSSLIKLGVMALESILGNWCKLSTFVDLIDGVGSSKSGSCMDGTGFTSAKTNWPLADSPVLGGVNFSEYSILSAD